MFTPCSPRVRVTSRPTGSAPTAVTSAVACPRWARVIRTLPSAPATRSRNPETSSSRPSSTGSSSPITSPTATTSNRPSPTRRPLRGLDPQRLRRPQWPGRAGPDAHRVAGEVRELDLLQVDVPDPGLVGSRLHGTPARLLTGSVDDPGPRLAVQPVDAVHLTADLGDGRTDGVGHLVVRRAQHLRGALQVVGHEERATA